MKLATEKSFNRSICPVINIKGKPVEYPLRVKYKNFGFLCPNGIMGPKQMMIMDIIGTTLIHREYSNHSYHDRIPTSNDKRVKLKSSEFMSYKLLKYVGENLSLSNTGLIPKGWYGSNNLYDIDKTHRRIKEPFGLEVDDGLLRKELPFLRKYSSCQIRDMIVQTSECSLLMNYPVRFFDGKIYQTFPFTNNHFPSKLFTIHKIFPTKTSQNNHVLARAYHILFDTLLGYMFAQNVISCYTDLLPGNYYGMSDYSQLFYRFFVRPYFNEVKNPISIDEVRRRLVLKTADTYMVRKVINRILKELALNHLISNPREEKVQGQYMYYYTRNTWKEITGEEESSETDLDNIAN